MSQPTPILPKSTKPITASAATATTTTTKPTPMDQHQIYFEAVMSHLGALVASGKHSLGTSDGLSGVLDGAPFAASFMAKKSLSMPHVDEFVSPTPLDAMDNSSLSGASSSPLYNCPSGASISTPALTPPEGIFCSLEGSPLFGSSSSASLDVSPAYALSALFPDMLSSCPSPSDNPLANSILSSGASCVAAGGPSSPAALVAGLESAFTSSVSSVVGSPKVSSIDSFAAGSIASIDVGSNSYDALNEASAMKVTIPKSSEVSNTPASPISATATSTPTSSLTAEVARKRRDSEFLASLPPQLALKRRRTGASKHKEKMLAELLSTSSTASAEPPKKTVQESPKTSDNSIDPNAIKRQKNTDAARRSRMRKILRIETLENRVTELETENISLNTKIGIIESEKLSLQQRESELTDHIRQLEKQLAAYQHGNMPLPSFFQ